MPLLARALHAPLAVEIRTGAVAALGPMLADRRISSGGHVAVVVGPGQGEALSIELARTLDNAEVFPVAGGSVDDALEVTRSLRGGFYDAVVGIGGGRVLDVAKYAATMAGLPVVAVATNLSHDGIASPVSSLELGGRKGSFGVQTPIAVIVDLDYVRRAPPRMRGAGIGDVVSNLSAIADWELAATERGEAVDGVAVAFSRTAAEAIVDRAGTVDDPGFLAVLAEGLVLSGLAMSAAGSSRPCSGGDHEILHAIDHLYPGTSNHGELAGVGALFTTFLRRDEALFARLDGCLRRHDLPRRPADLGLSDDQFARAVVHAPTTRPDRYTILEHLGLDLETTRERVREFVTTSDG